MAFLVDKDKRLELELKVKQQNEAILKDASIDKYETMGYISRSYDVPKIRKTMKKLYGYEPSDKKVESWYNNNMKDYFTRQNFDIEFKKSKEEWAAQFKPILNKLEKKRKSFMPDVKIAPWNYSAQFGEKLGEFALTAAKSVANIFLDDKNEYKEQSKAIEQTQTVRRMSKLKIDENQKKAKGLGFLSRFLDGVASGLIPDDIYQDDAQTKKQALSYITPYIQEKVEGSDNDGHKPLYIWKKNPDYMPDVAKMFKEGLYHFDETQWQAFTGGMGDLVGILGSFYLSGKVLPSSMPLITSALSKIKNPTQALRVANSIEGLLSSGKVEEAVLQIEKASKATKAIRFATGAVGSGVDSALQFAAVHLATTSSEDVSTVAAHGAVFGVMGHATGALMKPLAKALSNHKVAEKLLTVPLQMLSGGTGFAAGEAAIAAANGDDLDTVVDVSKKAFAKGAILSLSKAVGSESWKYGFSKAVDRTISRGLKGLRKDKLDKVMNKMSDDPDFILTALANNSKEAAKATKDNLDKLLYDPDGSINRERSNYYAEIVAHSANERETYREATERKLREKAAKGNVGDASFRETATPNSEIYDNDLKELLGSDNLKEGASELYDKYAGNEAMEAEIAETLEMFNEISKADDLETAIKDAKLPSSFSHDDLLLEALIKHREKTAKSSPSPQEPAGSNKTEDFSSSEGKTTPEDKTLVNEPSEDDKMLADLASSEPFIPDDTPEERDDKEFKAAVNAGLYTRVDGKLAVNMEKVNEIYSNEKSKAVAAKLILSGMVGDKETLLYDAFKKLSKDIYNNMPEDLAREVNILYKANKDDLSFTTKKLVESALKSGNIDGLKGVFVALKARAEEKRILESKKVWTNVINKINSQSNFDLEKTPGFIKIKTILDSEFGFDAAKRFGDLYNLANSSISREKFIEKFNESDESVKDLFKNEKDLLTKFYNFNMSMRDNSRFMRKGVAKLDKNGELTLVDASTIDKTQRQQKSSYISDVFAGEIMSVTIDAGKSKDIESTPIQDLSQAEQANFFAKMFKEHGYLPLMSHGAKTRLYFIKLHPELEKLRISSEAIDDMYRKEFKGDIAELNKWMEINMGSPLAEAMGKDFMSFQKLFALNQKLRGERMYGKDFPNVLKDVVNWNKRGQIPGSMGDYTQNEDWVERPKQETSIIQDDKSYYRGQIEEPTIDSDGNLILHGKEDKLYAKAGLKSHGVSLTEDMNSAVEYGNGQLEVAKNLASDSYDAEEELSRLSDNGYYLIQIPKEVKNEIVKEAGEVKAIGDKVIIPKGSYKIEHIVEDEEVSQKSTVKYRVETKKYIKREDIRNNPDKVYLFGDNLERKGLGGQAKEMRGEPNSIGIATKKKPSNTNDSFFTDEEFEENKKNIDNDFKKVEQAIAKGKTIVIPKDGIGTGLASLEKKAPKTFQYLQNKIKDISKLVEPAKTKTQAYQNVSQKALAKYTGMRKIHNLSHNRLVEIFGLDGVDKDEVKSGFDGNILIDQKLFDKLADLFGESNSTALKIFHHDPINGISHGTKGMWMRATDKQQEVLSREGIEILSNEYNSKYASGKEAEDIDMGTLRFQWADHISDINKSTVQAPSQFVNYIWNYGDTKEAFNEYNELLQKSRAKYIRMLNEALVSPDKFIKLIDQVFGSNTRQQYDEGDPTDLEIADLQAKNRTEEMINAYGANEFIANLPTAKDYMFQSVARYIFNKMIKPDMPGVTSVLRGQADWSGKIEDNAGIFGDNIGRRKIKVGKKKMTIAEGVALWKDGNRSKALEDALTLTVIRTPQEGIAGAVRVRVQDIIGDRTGDTIMLGKKAMERLGGADADGDKVATLFSEALPPKVKEMLDKYADFGGLDFDAELDKLEVPEHFKGKNSIFNINALIDSMVGNVNANATLEKVAGSYKFFNMLKASGEELNVDFQKTPEHSVLSGVSNVSEQHISVITPFGKSYLTKNLADTEQYFNSLLRTKTKDGGIIVSHPVTFWVTPSIGGTEAFIKAFTKLKAKMGDEFKAHIAMVTPKAYEAGYAGREVYTETEDGDKKYFRINPKANIIDAYREVMKSTNGEDADFHVMESYNDMFDKLHNDVNEVWNLDETRRSDEEINLVDHAMSSYEQRNGEGSFIRLPDRKTIENVFGFYIRRSADAGKYGGMPNWDSTEAEIYSRLFNDNKFTNRLEGKIFSKLVNERGTQKELRAAIKALVTGKGKRTVMTSAGEETIDASLNADEIYDLVDKAKEMRSTPSTGLEAALYDLPIIQLDVLSKIDVNNYLANRLHTIKNNELPPKITFLQKNNLDNLMTVDAGAEKIYNDKELMVELASLLPSKSINRDAIINDAMNRDTGRWQPSIGASRLHGGINELREYTNDLILQDAYKTAATNIWADIQKEFIDRFDIRLSALSGIAKNKNISNVKNNPDVLEAVIEVGKIEATVEKLVNEFNAAAKAAKKAGGKIPYAVMGKIAREMLYNAPEDKLFEKYYYFKFFDPIHGSMHDVGNKRSAASRIVDLLPFIPENITKELGSRGQEVLNQFKRTELERKPLEGDASAGTLNVGFDPVSIAKALKIYVSKADKRTNFNNAVYDFFKDYYNKPPLVRFDPTWGEDNPENVFRKVTGIASNVPITPEFIDNGMTKAQKVAFYDYAYTLGLATKINNRIGSTGFWKKFYDGKLPKTVLEKYPIGQKLVYTLEEGIMDTEAFSQNAANLVEYVAADMDAYAKKTGKHIKEIGLKLALAMNSKEGYESADPDIRSIADKMRHSQEFSGKEYNGNMFKKAHDMLEATRRLTASNVMRVVDHKLRHGSKYDIASFIGAHPDELDKMSATDINNLIERGKTNIERSLRKPVGYNEYYYPHQLDTRSIDEHGMAMAIQDQLMKAGLINAEEYAASISLTYEAGHAKQRENEEITFDPNPVEDIGKYIKSVANAYQHNLMLDAFIEYQDSSYELMKTKEMTKENYEAMKWVNEYVKGVALHAFGNSNRGRTIDNATSALASFGFSAVAANPVSSMHNMTQRLVANYVAGKGIAKEARAWGKNEGQLSINGQNVATWSDASKRIGIAQSSMSDYHSNHAFEDLTTKKIDIALLSENKLYKEYLIKAEEDFRAGKITEATKNKFVEHYTKELENNEKLMNEKNYSKDVAEFFSKWVEAVAEGRILPQKAEAGKIRNTLGRQIPGLNRFLFKAVEIGNRLYAGKVGYYQGYKLKAKELEANRHLFEKMARRDINAMEEANQNGAEIKIPELQDLVTQMMHTEADKAGIAGARQMISYTQFDYHGWNTPKWARTPTQKMLFQFKTFLAHQANLFEKQRQEAVKHHKVGLYEDAYLKGAKLLLAAGGLATLDTWAGVSGLNNFLPIPAGDEAEQIYKLLMGDKEAFYGKGLAGVPLYFSGVAANMMYDGLTNFYLANYKGDKRADKKLTKKFGIFAQIDNAFDKKKTIDWRYIAPEYGYRWVATANRLAAYIPDAKSKGRKNKLFMGLAEQIGREIFGVGERWPEKKHRKRSW